jgi:hypothetical protein
MKQGDAFPQIKAKIGAQCTRCELGIFPGERGMARPAEINCGRHPPATVSALNEFQVLQSSIMLVKGNRPPHPFAAIRRALRPRPRGDQGSRHARQRRSLGPRPPQFGEDQVIRLTPSRRCPRRRPGARPDGTAEIWESPDGWSSIAWTLAISVAVCRQASPHEGEDRLALKTRVEGVEARQAAMEALVEDAADLSVRLESSRIGRVPCGAARYRDKPGSWLEQEKPVSGAGYPGPVSPQATGTDQACQLRAGKARGRAAGKGAWS